MINGKQPYCIYYSFENRINSKPIQQGQFKTLIFSHSAFVEILKAKKSNPKHIAKIVRTFLQRWFLKIATNCQSHHVGAILEKTERCNYGNQIKTISMSLGSMEIYALGNANKNLEALNFLPTFDRGIQDRE